ncbi:SDR family NAD(P)-dependent oxidoreductase [Streptomyces sp. NPDC052040]|uniref:SDR family NAD(P)-dependent oxidoreductase n=1 Tax=unclassified Streptomyces TaxID=2593676 RepID=UPI0037D48B8E
MNGAAEGRPVALVSGGSRGLGRLLVERLLADGWRVATFSRDPAADRDADADHGRDTDRLLRGRADLTDAHSLRAFAAEAQHRFGRLDLLVNNAGQLHEGLLLTTPLTKITELIAVNLTASVVLAQCCAKPMVRQGGGAIVNVSSINAIRGFRGVSVYAAAKAGVDGFMRSLARELGSFNIRVNSVVPGFFDSGMTSHVPEQQRERIEGRTPLGRLGTAREVADAVLFLASPEARFITGQSIVVDGGITC